jgi:Ca2+-binding EF-hand superfamily protein
LDKSYDIDPILKLFTEFDKGNDGLLTVEDIERLIQKYNETADPNKGLVSILFDDVKEIFSGNGTG